MNSLIANLAAVGLTAFTPVDMARSISCWDVGYHYDAQTKTETFFVRRTGLVLGTFVDANAPAPDPQQAALERGLCTNYPSALGNSSSAI